MMWGNGWGDWFLGFLMMAAFWGGLAILVVLLLRDRDRERHRPPAGSVDREARQILAERFAKGEITEDEFEQRRQVLTHAAS